jgi:hypothetical protein
MSDPLTVLALVAAVLAGLTVLLSRIVPDHYDHASLRRVDNGANDPA